MGGGRGSWPRESLRKKAVGRSCRSQVGSLLRPVKGRQKPAGVGQRALAPAGPATETAVQTGCSPPSWVSPQGRGTIGGALVDSGEGQRLPTSLTPPSRPCSSTGKQNRPASRRSVPGRHRGARSAATPARGPGERAAAGGGGWFGAA